MAEVGLVLFARTALEVMREVLPAYSGKYSKHPFTQPHLMTSLCLIRFEDWTFREAAGRTRRGSGRGGRCGSNTRSRSPARPARVEPQRARE